MSIKQAWPTKDPNESLDYSIVWSHLTGDDPITGFDWTVPIGLTGGTETLSGYTTSVTLSGGTSGVTYEVRCDITTTAGRTYSRNIKLPVESR